MSEETTRFNRRNAEFHGEDITLGEFVIQSAKTQQAKPMSCVRCGHEGIVADFGEICPKCGQNPKDEDIACPQCHQVGWLSRSGWMCPRCPPTRGNGALYHRCKDGVVRIITQTVGVCCGVCKEETWANAPAKIARKPPEFALDSEFMRRLRNDREACEL
jgi:hypothetical protein